MSSHASTVRDEGRGQTLLMEDISSKTAPCMRSETEGIRPVLLRRMTCAGQILRGLLPSAARAGGSSADPRASCRRNLPSHGVSSFPASKPGKKRTRMRQSTATHLKGRV